MCAARSLFNKPTWAAPSQASPAADAVRSPDTPNDGPEAQSCGPAIPGDPHIFTRAALAYEDTMRRKERKRTEERAKARQKKEREEKRKSEAAEQDRAEGSLRKKPRISDEDYARYGLVSPTKKAAANAPAEEEEGGYEVTQDAGIENGDGVPIELGARNSRAKPEASTKEVVTLSSDDEDERPPPPASRRKAQKASSPPPIDSDEEFPALVALARQRRAQQEAEEREAQQRDGMYNPHGPASTSKPSMTAEEANEIDPIVMVLVTSPLPNTKPLLVHRRLSQRFLEIRTVWCERQGFSPERTSDIFFVYRMRRIYDVTTCKSLGIKVDDQGRLVPGPDAVRERILGGLDDFDAGGDKKEDPGKIHVTAVDEEAFRAMKLQKDQARSGPAVSGGGQTAEGGRDEEQEAAAPKKEDGVKIRVLLKAKDYNDYKLIVRPTTTFDRIMTAFKKEKKLGDDREVVLTFDGERLEPEDDIQSAEIEDMDAIEVYVR